MTSQNFLLDHFTLYSLGERNGKGVGMKYKAAPIGVKVIEKETRKIPELQMVTLRIHNYT